MDEVEAEKKINELEDLLLKLEEKKVIVNDIHNSCEQLPNFGEIKSIVKVLLDELTTIITVIRENQTFMRNNLQEIAMQKQTVPVVEIPVITPDSQIASIENNSVIDNIKPETQAIANIKPETSAIATQTNKEMPTTDNIMVIQSFNSEGETIQIYNVPSHSDDNHQQNVIVEAKYSRGQPGESKRASELVLKNIPKHFETTFVEPDETTTEVSVDPDGSKRIIVRKSTKTIQSHIKSDDFEGAVPENILSQLGLSGTTHDVIIQGNTTEPTFEQNDGIIESSIHAVIGQVSKTVIKKTRTIIKKVTIINGEEHVTEEVIQEPDEIEEFNETLPVSTTTCEISEVFDDVQKQETLPEVQFIDPDTIIITDDCALHEEEQVFDTQIAPLILNASTQDVDKQKSPQIQEVENIWPYNTAHIVLQQTTVSEVSDVPTIAENFDDSLNVWPQNLNIGSNVDFNDYSFNHIIEKTSDIMDDDGFVLIDSGLDQTDVYNPPSSKLELSNRFDDVDVDVDSQPTIEQTQIPDLETSPKPEIILIEKPTDSKPNEQIETITEVTTVTIEPKDLEIKTEDIVMLKTETISEPTIQPTEIESPESISVEQKPESIENITSTIVETIINELEVTENVSIVQQPIVEEVSVDIQDGSQAKVEKPISEEYYETYQVTLKVDPNEVNKISVNMMETEAPNKKIDLPKDNSEKSNDQVQNLPEIQVQETGPLSIESNTPDKSTSEVDKSESQDTDSGKKKNKSNKKKKNQKAKLEESLSIEIPDSPNKSAAVSEALSIDNDNVMPEEETLPEGNVGMLESDETYKSFTETPELPVKIMEESVLSSPDESLQTTHETLVYPGNVIEFQYFGDTEQQTDLTKEQIDKADFNKATLEIDTKEIQTSINTLDNETQMSPNTETFNAQAIVPSTETPTLELVETESQTIDEQKLQQEQEVQTDESNDNKPTVAVAPTSETTETSVQTIKNETHEEFIQTEDVPAIDTNAPEIVELLVTEIILQAVQNVPDKKEEAIEELITEPIVDEIVTIDTKEPTIEEPLKSSTTETVPEPEEIKTIDSNKNKSKKNKKNKSKQKDDGKVEISIEEGQNQITSKIEVSLKSEGKSKSKENELDVQVTVTTPLASAPAQDESESQKQVLIQRLNEIMCIETNEPQKDTDQFGLSQNLNSMITNIEQQGIDAVPWDEVQYMIDSNVESRRINNSNDNDDFFEFYEDNEMETTDNIEQSLDKVEQYINLLPEIVNSNEEKLTQKTIVIITKVFVSCLEQVEYRQQISKQNKGADNNESELEHLKRLEELLNELKSKITPLKNTELKENINRCICTLKQHVNLDKDIEESVVKDQLLYHSMNNDTNDSIRKLKEDTDLLEQKFKFSLHADSSINDKLKLLEYLDSMSKENKKKSSQLIRQTNTQDEQAHQIRTCYDRTCEVEHNIRLERRRIVQLISLSEEYEQTLNEFSQITLIANTLVDKTIVTNSLDLLQNEIQRHRKFFVNLNHCRNILESLEKNLDSETRLKHSQLHNSLHEKATIILEKAGERSQKLSLAASRWTLLDKRMKSEESWLQVAEQRVPDLSTVTSADYEQYITLYQSLITDITTHQSKMMQNYETANKLQDLICAPNLETKCNDNLTKITKIKEDVLFYLKKLTVFKSMWNEYNMNADRLENWMNYVEEELTQVNIPDNYLDYPVENMRNFWEIKAQYEVHNQIYNNVCESFEKSLKIIGIADDKQQLQFYAQLEDRWRNVSDRIGTIKNQITENISSGTTSYIEKLSFLERELDELMFILNNIKGIIRNPEELHLYIERLIVLKSRIVIVEHELVTIGFVSAVDTEKVGELCDKAHKVSLHITEEIELADLCRGKMKTLKQEIDGIKSDQRGFYDNLNQFEYAAKLESAAIEKALIECSIMKDNLVNHWQDIMRVRHQLHTLPTVLRMSVSPVEIEKEISVLEDDYVDIEKRLQDAEMLLKNRFVLWKRFEKQLEIIQQNIQETDFMVELLTVHGNIDYERLQKATERLEVISI